MKCPKCSGDPVFPEGLSGEKVCSRCGLVINPTSITRGFTYWTPEWFSNYSECDSEAMHEWLTVLRTVSCQLSVPKFPYIEEAARTIRQEKQLFLQSPKLAKKKRATVAALIHLILKEYHKARPIKDICQQLSLNNKTVAKQAWILKKTISTHKELLNVERKTSKDYLFKYGGKIADDHELLYAAEKTLSIMPKRIGGNPLALAAGAFYHACKSRKLKISKEQIGQAFYISPRTVDTNERKIRNILITPTLMAR